MFLLGLAAVVQIVFLPGFLVLRLMRIRLGFFGGAIASFGLSLVINHFLVCGLVLAGIYRSGVIYGIFAAECLLWLLLVHRSGRISIAQALRRLGANIRGTCADFLPQSLDDKPGLLRMVILLAAVGLLTGYVLYETIPPDRIFTENDAVVSWNRWACEWAGNRLPVNTAEYPQLLPSNLSLAYVFIGTASVWFFAKAVMFLFSLGALLAVFDLGLKTKQIGYLLGTIITYLLFHGILRARNLSSGYADVPVAFFAFGSAYLLLVGQVGNLSYVKNFLMAAVFAAGAALTKQTGVFYAAVFPLLAYSLHKAATGGRTDKTATTGRGFLKELILATLLMGLLIAPWYLAKLWQIRHGGDFSMAQHLFQDIHCGRSAWQRLVHAGGLLGAELSLPGLILLLIGLLAAIRNPVGRRFVFFLIAPFTLIWALELSYDTRNLAMLIPFAGTAAGLGLMEILRAAEGRLALRGATLWRWVPNLLSLPVGAIFLLLLIGLAVLGGRISTADLTARQEALQKRIGVADLDEGLYAYQRKHGFTSGIATDYYCLEWLPELSGYYRECSSQDLSAFLAVYNQPEVGYALLHKSGTASAVRDYLERARNDGKVRLVLDSRYYRLYKKQ